MNAVHSSRSSPWHLSWVFSAYNIHAEDDDYEDYEDYEDYDYDDDNEF